MQDVVNMQPSLRVRLQHRPRHIADHDDAGRHGARHFDVGGAPPRPSLPHEPGAQSKPPRWGRLCSNREVLSCVAVQVVTESAPRRARMAALLHELAPLYSLARQSL